MTVGPREAVASEGQVSESKLLLGSEALYHDLSQELLNHTARGPAIQPARLGPAHAAILALCENAADTGTRPATTSWPWGRWLRDGSQFAQISEQIPATTSWPWGRWLPGGAASTRSPRPRL